jgi:spore coat polysaccharide biosynthesis predicted glycosyltransferase SpsG/CMP-N-acetylneuraminic acid synthetase
LLRSKELEDIGSVMGPAVVIPAVKKNVAFPDDLVKKLAGVSLIQRAINIAVKAFGQSHVYVLTDSEEIDLVCRRNNVTCLYDRTLRLDPENYFDSLKPHILPLMEYWQDIMVLSPYIPLVRVSELQDAYRYYHNRKAELLVPVNRGLVRPYAPWPRQVGNILHYGSEQEFATESSSFSIFSSDLLCKMPEHLVELTAYPLNGRIIEIRSYEDWWLCEKLLNRRRIVFRIMGHKTVGMGHIYRCLTLAHEIADHEIRFVCDIESSVAASKLAGYDYWLGVYDPKEIVDAIIALEPDLVINDILDTDAEYIRRLKNNGIKVVNFEDLGSGATEADLTINDLFDEPLFINKGNILWGNQWFFVRDEFTDAKPHRFKKEVSRILIAFGGTDPNDLTRKILHTALPYCAKRGIAIDVVTGEGYGHIEELEKEIAGIKKPEVSYTFATGIISDIMEKTEIAISSNGRTVYELAHMNIPAIVLSQNDREKTHRFACEENGFIPLGIYSGEDSKQTVHNALQRLVQDADYRHKLFLQQQQTNFARNKGRVIQRILSLMKVTA